MPHDVDGLLAETAISAITGADWPAHSSGIALAPYRGKMTMLRWNVGQRQVLVDKLPDAANLVVGALFVGHFLSDRPFSLTLALSGIAAWVALMGLALVVARGDDQS